LTHPLVLAGVAGIPVLAVLLLVSIRRTEAFVVGALFFLMAILSTMQILQFSNIIAADKFVYLPAEGPVLVIA